MKKITTAGLMLLCLLLGSCSSLPTAYQASPENALALIEWGHFSSQHPNFILTYDSIVEYMHISLSTYTLNDQGQPTTHHYDSYLLKEGLWEQESSETWTYQWEGKHVVAVDYGPEGSTQILWEGDKLVSMTYSLTGIIEDRFEYHYENGKIKSFTVDSIDLMGELIYEGDQIVCLKTFDVNPEILTYDAKGRLIRSEVGQTISLYFYQELVQDTDIQELAKKHWPEELR